MSIYMIRSYISRTKHAFLTDSLFRNAALLMSSTAIMSVLGFGFWLFVAHMYKPADVGIASALISITVLLSNLSMMGLSSGLIRFLPKSDNQSGTINAAMITVGGATTIAALLYVLLGAHFGANMSLLANGWHKAIFVVLLSSISLNSITDSVFIANRRAEFHTAAYALLGVVKLLLPLGLVSLAATGIFAAYILSMVASLIFSLFLMTRWCDYSLLARPDWHMLGRIRKFATNNYLALIITGLPSQIIPTLIIRHIGAAQVAFFSMAWTMANLLYIIPSATTQSLLAESSHNPEDRQYHLKHTVKILSLILVPAVVGAILIAPYLLRIFGPQYSHEGTRIFQILALATFPYAFACVAGTRLNIEHRSFGIVITQVALLLTTFISLIFLLRFRLAGVGIAMLLGNIAACITYVVLGRRHNKHLPINPVIIEPTAG
ncbi:MAG TPA: oligosaccharide flippase family protein [Candidatus Saccharimonadales bacterium]|nr:oligosaccharide flippase family protein [Candidatus Saccharimonadales bacterium]